MVILSKMAFAGTVSPPDNNFATPSLSYYDITSFILKTSHLDNHTTNDVKPEILLGVQTGNRIPDDICGIAHVGARDQKPRVSRKRCNHSTTHLLAKHMRRWTYSVVFFHQQYLCNLLGCLINIFDIFHKPCLCIL